MALVATGQVDLQARGKIKWDRVSPLKFKPFGIPGITKLDTLFCDTVC